MQTGPRRQWCDYEDTPDRLESWQTALLALGYFVVASNIEMNIAEPRILRRAVHVHPVVSLLALMAGAEAFGLWGALFAAPAIGVAQALLSAEWRGWREAHLGEYPEIAATVPVSAGDDNGTASPERSSRGSLRRRPA